MMTVHFQGLTSVQMTFQTSSVKWKELWGHKQANKETNKKQQKATLGMLKLEMLTVSQDY